MDERDCVRRVGELLNGLPKSWEKRRKYLVQWGGKIFSDLEEEKGKDEFDEFRVKLDEISVSFTRWLPGQKELQVRFSSEGEKCLLGENALHGVELPDALACVLAGKVPNGCS